MDRRNIYEQGLERRESNFTPLSPLSFLERSARVYPDYPSIVHGAKRFTWSETYERCRRLASALARRGIGAGDTVAVMGSNTPETYETAFGVPMTGAVLNTLNVRLDPESIGFCLNHGEAKALLTDTEFEPTVSAALKQLGRDDIIVIDIADSEAGHEHVRIGEMDYEALLETGDADGAWSLPNDEWNAITLNYTSGTTGDPKGVVYHHRGAYLNALSNAVGWNMPHHSVYLWTLPMFHCNGWCFPWTNAALANVNVCLRKVTGANIHAAIADRGVTHFCGAPIVLNMVTSATNEERRDFNHQVHVMTAAAPPPAATLANMQRDGFDVTHVYGLTEVYGPAVICSWHREWDNLPIEEQARLKSRQGVNYHVLNALTVRDPETLEETPWDGETMGEVMFQGNVVMKGYLKNPATSDASLDDGWFRSGDLGVVHPDGYIQLKDRSKDIIISGGENISSIEVEDMLHKHPAVLACGVVAKPDDKWGETPCAFIELRAGMDAPTEADVIQFCRDNMAGYKCPRHVVFGELPKTSTGKIQKFKLRDIAREKS